MTLYERFEKMSESDLTTSTRGRLLSRAGKVCLGLAVAAAGLARAETSKAGGAGCCVLAYQTECPHCTGSGYDCGTGCTRWAWHCVDSSHHVWLCGECYAGGSCSGCSCGHIAIPSLTSRPGLGGSGGGR
jgi:hypothetical protein